tara:strand:- start:1037 stop:1762 length:726 start_codon:yes stop_codon:yes gene_type:complete
MRIETYPIVAAVLGQDRLLGTQAVTEATKNFTIDQLVNFINITSAVDSQTLRYKFQVLGSGIDQAKGTFTFAAGGSTVNFADVTGFKLSSYSLRYLSQGAATDISAFYTKIISTQVFISNTKDISQFGVYTWNSAVQAGSEEFYNIGLTPVATQGTLKRDSEYFISLLSWDVSAGGGDKNFVFTQGTPALVWTVQHDLNKFPSVSVVNSLNEIVYGKVDYIDKNKLTVTFAAAFSGAAYCN